MYFFALEFYFFNRSDILFREVIGNVFSYAYVGGFELHIPLERNSQSAIAVRLSAPNGKVCSN